MIKILQGDCREVLKTLPDASINCCVTSPPYFNLRDYQTGTWTGGDPQCDHIQSWNKHGGERADRNQEGQKKQYKDVCGRCGAVSIDLQIGKENTPEAYVNELVSVFREVRRVLRDDGTCWINLGDSFAGSGKGPAGNIHKGRLAGEARHIQGKYKTIVPEGCKPKDLMGIPWMTAFGLRNDGWYLRQDMIWNKPNPQPESVKDRCTKAHEYIFLLTKSPHYFFDYKAIQEPAAYDGRKDTLMKGGIKYKRTDETGLAVRTMAANPHERWKTNDAGEYVRNKRSVWTVATKPYPGSHFATFPAGLIRPCILAGCPTGGTVLDPFGGSGTTGEVAAAEGRNAILIELNPNYTNLMRNRCGLFVEQ